ncbi:MAG: adenylosuccinate synthase [Bacteroidetes bacterium]|nr:adenylosuccinate synthase [Bacteroidota bacterium]
MAVDVILGLQWGDEGKGKIVDYYATDYDIIARFQGGPNAGHTLKLNGQQFVLHTIPSGIFNDHIINVIGNGVVIDPVVFRAELDNLITLGIDVKSRLLISKKAHLILPTHRLLDAAAEKAKGKSKIGSTLKGIAPAYMDKTGRNGLRVGDLLLESFNDDYQFLVNKHKALLENYNFEFDLAPLESEWQEAVEIIRSLNLIDCEHYINDQIIAGKKIMAEGAQGTLLDIDYGTYPYVTSSNTISASACIGLGIAPNQIRDVIGIAKAYCTRVGNGPFPSELDDETGELLRKVGNEFGATTGRERRCGWIDLPALKYSIMLNGATQMILTKVDVLNEFDEIKVCTHYDLDKHELNNNKTERVDRVPYDLHKYGITPVYKSIKGWNTEIKDSIPELLEDYLEYLEKELNIKIPMISIGPAREQIIRRTAESII